MVACPSASASPGIERPRAPATAGDDDGGLPPDEGRRWNETLSSAAVILAGVLVVVGFGFVASRAMRSHNEAPNVSVPQAPALGEVTLPSSLGQPGPDPADQPVDRRRRPPRRRAAADQQGGRAAGRRRRDHDQHRRGGVDGRT